MVTQLTQRLSDALRTQAKKYTGDNDRPLGGYVAAMGTYSAGVAALAAVVRASGKPVPDGFAWRDLFLSAVATHKLSRLIAKGSGDQSAARTFRFL